MSETELPTGRDSLEQEVGHRQPLPEWNPTPDEPKEYSRGDAGVVDASNDLSRERGSTEPPLIKIIDKRHDSDNRKYYDTAENAAHDLSEYHKAENAAQAAENLNALAADVDLARVQLAGPDHVDALAKLQAQALHEAEIEAHAEASGAPPADAPQAESAEQPSGLDPDFAALLEKKPQLRAQLEAPFQQAEAARQAFTGATAQVTGLLVAELAADLPEIMSLPPEQRLVGLQILQNQQPERFALLEAKAGRIQSAYNVHLQNTAAAAQQQQQAFQSWAKAQDKELEAKVPEISNDPDMRVSKAALKSLKDVGYTEQELAAAWNGQAFSMRDHRAQLLIWKAAQYDMAKAGVGRPEAAQLPPVQRPGIAPSVGERTFVDTSDLRKQLKSARGIEAVKIATKLHQAQRRARG